MRQKLPVVTQYTKKQDPVQSEVTPSPSEIINKLKATHAQMKPSFKKILLIPNTLYKTAPTVVEYIECVRDSEMDFSEEETRIHVVQPYLQTRRRLRFPFSHNNPFSHGHTTH